MPFIPLDPSEYRRVQPLITEHERVYLPPTLSILEQVQPGEVYVDDRNHPTCAAVLRTSSMGGRQTTTSRMAPVGLPSKMET